MPGNPSKRPGSRIRAPQLPSLIRTLRDVLAIPTAPFHEIWLRDYLEQRLAKLPHVRTKVDRSGNLFVHYRPKKSRGPAALCIQTHLDHPGFTVEKAGVCGYGGLPENCLGAKLRFFSGPGQSGVSATILKFEKQALGYKTEIKAAKKLTPGSIGMWSFPPLRQSGGWLEGRSFDDTLGVAIAVYTLENMVKRRHGTPIDFLFTRAEEVGYVGLLDAAKRPGFRAPKFTLTIEMPRAGGELVPGDGVMIRTGDRNVNFDPEALLFIDQAATELKKKLPWFKSQRRLGSYGGTEVTVFQLLGSRAACLCLPVVNGHNIDRKNKGRPAPERVHTDDLMSLIALLEELVKKPWDTERSKVKLEKRIRKNARRYSGKLGVGKGE